MASTNQTANYGLSQFVGADQLTRADYNADMSAIDTALHTIASAVTGGQIEMQKTETYIQWRYIGDATWINLVALADITGPTGATGTAGTDGTDGTDGVGIASITRTSGDGSAGTTDTYTITYTDSTTSTFTVYNGADGTNGIDGTDGDDGRGITSIVRTSGTGAAGTTDTYTITYTDSTTSTFTVYNGADGEGAGDMTESVWATDGAIKVEKGGTGATTAAGALTNLGALGTSGNGSNVTAAFTAAGARADIATGETLATLFGKLKKWFADFGALAWLGTVGASQIDANAVTNAKLAQMAAKTVKGNLGTTTADPSDVTMLDVTEYGLSAGTTATSVADAEYIPISVSATSTKKITWANVKAAIQTALSSVFAAKGANSDITSLSGLTTALSVAQGGTGATTAANALTALGAQAITTITVNANASPALGTLANNTEYRCTNTSLSAAPTMTIAAIASTSVEFVSSVVYKSPGTTAPVVTNNSGYTLKYSGSDVSSGTWTPVSGTVYRISFAFDGIYLNAYVMGVA